MLEITTVLGFSLRLLISAGLGALIGAERQLKKHYAGIVTTMIVCVGSYAFTAFSYLSGDSDADYTRIAAQVVCGIGFLGAGVIISDGTKITGINTAATVWASAAVGILCCVDTIWYAVVVAVMIVIIHLLLHPISEYIEKRQRYDQKKKEAKKETYYKISVTCSSDNAGDVKQCIIQRLRDTDAALLRTLEMVPMEGDNVKVRAIVSTKVKDNTLIENLSTHIAKHNDVLSTGWQSIQ